jgi:hypothetical protein
VLPVLDGDGDGVADSEDSCPDSILSTFVVIDGCDSGVANSMVGSGCTISNRIAEIAEGATNHGQFVSGVAQFTNDLRRDGVITNQERSAIQSCAAQADLP